MELREHGGSGDALAFQRRRRPKSAGSHPCILQQALWNANNGVRGTARAVAGSRGPKHGKQRPSGLHVPGMAAPDPGSRCQPRRKVNDAPASRLPKDHRGAEQGGHATGSWGFGERPAHPAISRNLQKALASCICLGLRHSTSRTTGLQTRYERHLPREVATFRRLRL